MADALRIVVGGASGFLGGPLVDELRDRGHAVTRLVRGTAHDADASHWDPYGSDLDQRLIDDADVVVNLSGAPIQRWPRTAKYREEILRSRLAATSTLARAVARSKRPAALLSASGMSYYGADRGDTLLPESGSAGDGFLASVSQQWEAATAPAVEAGARVCLLRTSLVLDESGGALKLMAIPFRRYGGAVLGSGDQYMSYISRVDWVRAVVHLAEGTASGPVNMATADPVTNRQFTAALAEAVDAKAFLKAPAPVLKLALGGLSDELLGSLRLEPLALSQSGFTFEAPDIGSTLRLGLKD
ncbi:TIGR01777 family oxidoreductase [Aeromicrobium sp. Leaf350]|uniref:TIGR01777 family oxidoreductase n=1 Tax=Aeromicrobium sp. Leaf350 TaxID=2876565 RepID=UPI001E4380FD|nr:TIGR01777 family oxidoreductase [Aeromicrobium sp. Leaf350]